MFAPTLLFAFQHLYDKAWNTVPPTSSLFTLENKKAAQGRHFLFTYLKHFFDWSENFIIEKIINKLHNDKADKTIDKTTDGTG